MTYLHPDVTDENDWRAALAACDEKGGVDILANNAGIVTFGGIEAISPTAFRHILEVNLTGVYLGMHLAAGYVASKWGVRGLTKAAALNVAGTGIKPNY